MKISCKFSRSFILVMKYAAMAALFFVMGSTNAAEVKKITAIPELRVSVDKGVPVMLEAPAASVFIANPDVADVQVMSPTAVMVYGKKTGQTTLMAIDNEGKTLLLRTVMVSQNLDDLRQALNAVIPGHKIKVESVPNGIVLTGEANDPSVIEDARRLAMRYVPKETGEVINRIKVRGSNQIQIRVRFAEVARDVDKRFGIDWESIGNVGGFAVGLMSGNAATVLSSGSNLLNRTRPSTGTNTNDIISFSTQGSNYNINGLIDALAAEGFITVLAEPTLTAKSGETASFLAGGEFPVPVPQGQQTITVEWKTFGVSLAFTPTIIGEDRISLHVRPEVSQLSESGAITLNNITVPALTTRRAETTIELASGQSFALGGLLNNNQTQTVNKFPFLGDTPIIGPLFRSTRFQNNQSELVIIITPYIVRPTDQEKLTLPTDGFRPPSDIDRIFRNRTTSDDMDVRPISGEPRAVRIDEGKDKENLAPLSAPLEPVSSYPNTGETTASPKKPFVGNEQRLSLPAQERVSKTSVTDKPLGLSGYGGFIVE